MFNDEKPKSIINYASNKLHVNQINMSMGCTISKPMYVRRFGFLVMNEELFISKIYFLRGLFKVYRVENR